MDRGVGVEGRISCFYTNGKLLKSHGNPEGLTLRALAYLCFTVH